MFYYFILYGNANQSMQIHFFKMLAEVEVAVDGEEIDVPIFPKKKDIRFNRKVDSARPDVDIFETLVEEVVLLLLEIV